MICNVGEGGAKEGAFLKLGNRFVQEPAGQTGVRRLACVQKTIRKGLGSVHRLGEREDSLSCQILTSRSLR